MGVVTPGDGRSAQSAMHASRRGDMSATISANEFLRARSPCRADEAGVLSNALLGWCARCSRLGLC